MKVTSGPECVVEGDWLTTLPDYQDHFAVILSDLTSGNVAYDDRPRFYSLISSALSPGGLFLDKVLTHPIPHLRISSLIEKYSRLPLNLLYVNHFSCEVLFCSELLSHDETSDSTRFYEFLDREVKSERIRIFARRSRLVTPERCRWYYGRDWRFLKPEYCPQLRKVSVKDDEGNSPYFGRLKFFTFQKSGKSRA